MVLPLFIIKGLRIKIRIKVRLTRRGEGDLKFSFNTFLPLERSTTSLTDQIGEKSGNFPFYLLFFLFCTGKWFSLYSRIMVMIIMM